MMKNLFFYAALLAAIVTNGQTADRFPMRLKVATYNVGHFNQGAPGGYPGGQNPKAELFRWRKWIGEQSLDIFSMNEWNSNFDKDSTLNATDALLKPYYNNIYFGDRHKWIYNGIATNYSLTNIRMNYSWGDYYALIGDLKIGNKIITIISTHIPWQKDAHPSALAGLIKELRKYEYFICFGDMNAANTEQQKFQEAGFNIANGGNMGWFCTAPTSRTLGKTDINIDNIITSKNIKIMHVTAPFTGLNDDDHLPLIADLVITW
ncbi:endonuclease/exonuclease/phosphatase [Niabella ginsenosidivorans]|uniref:Endonuclease/exonuclease/phosphatase n=1 Tax=Niabella ginsenosidivorans TaxID=1176587 RepID=A0A1A9I1V1_9BACT|nr:endonuclease/exonuclease/phosphatase family protein [Niabella ginsenosidivorans]ANH81628.1 endonuclease/exonuclease/phosphatase [Niabella ginsenosidivorans]